MLRFRSLRSGSSGNLLLLESLRGRAATRLLIDCGISSQRECLRLLEEEAGLGRPVDGLLVTHAHTDHLSYSGLRVMGRLRVPIYLHAQTRREVGHRLLSPYRLPAGVRAADFEFRVFEDEPFSIGPFAVAPLRVPHAPGVTTHAYRIRHGRTRLLIASDFNDPEAVVPHIYDCDFVYLESNHDLELLRLHFNPASLYHLSNPAAGLLLRHAWDASRRPPAQVVLGHLSHERNRPELALATVREALKDGGHARPVELIAAPRHAASGAVVIEE
jgi:phosphoribosyl 1,2-cyclic phosphodiesterase